VEYPFFLTRSLAGSGELWSLLEEAAFWIIDRLREYPDATARTAIDWLASVDSRLRLEGVDASRYWRYHLTTLLHSVEGRLETDEQAVISGLKQAIGEKNRMLFSRIWSEVELTGPRWPPISQLEKVVLSERRQDIPAFWALQREIDHFTLKQLGLSHPLHIPLILFAWHRNLGS